MPAAPEPTSTAENDTAHRDGVVRIGLVRHFPVSEGMPRGWMTGRELHAWRQRYDVAAVNPCAIGAVRHAWSCCLSSDLPRAVTTAQALHDGSITLTPLLREPQLAEFRTGRLRLPSTVWPWVLRLAWMTRHPSQRRARIDFQEADLLDDTREHTLVVSHAGMMAFLRAELVRRGFSGPSFRVAEHARLYVFERVLRQSRT